MIARAITAIIGVVIGLFATFAVFSAILGGLDNLYLLTQDACNYGSDNSPKRILRAAPENPDHPGDADEIDWTAHGLELEHDGRGNCRVVGDFDPDLRHLTPTGDRVTLEVMRQLTAGIPPTPPRTELQASATMLDSETLHTSDLVADIWVTNNRGAYVSNPATGQTSTTAYVFTLGSNALSSPAADHTIPLDVNRDYGRGVVFDGPNFIWVINNSDMTLERYAVRSPNARNRTLTLESGPTYHDIDLHQSSLFVLASNPGYELRTYDRSGNAGPVWPLDTGIPNLERVGMTIAGDDELILLDPAGTLYVVPNFRQGDVDVARISVTPSRGTFRHGISIAPNNNLYLISAFGNDIILHHYIYYLSGGGVAATYATGGLPWIPAEDVFTAQGQLVTLLAVIAAIGMPIGAMTAIVFFGQAVLSSGLTGSGASQVLVAIAAVVIILVSIQMFQQFAGFLGTAFDAVNGDRFVVFDAALGSLAETIAEFWGVLAFAGFINIATIVWRNYSGNFSIGGSQGGL